MCTSGEHFNHQRFQAKILFTTSIIRNLFVYDAELAATSFKETQKLVDRLPNYFNAFWPINRIAKTEVIHQAPSVPIVLKVAKIQTTSFQLFSIKREMISDT